MNSFHRFYENLITGHLRKEYDHKVGYICFNDKVLIYFLKHDKEFRKHMKHNIKPKDEFLYDLYKIYTKYSQPFETMKELRISILKTYFETKKIPIYQLKQFCEYICELTLLMQEYIDFTSKTPKFSQNTKWGRILIEDHIYFENRINLFMNTDLEDLNIDLKEFDTCSLDYWEDEEPLIGFGIEWEY